MKVVALGQAKNGISARVDQAQRDVLVTRHGKPAAIIVGVEGEDFEDLRSDPEFWQMIEAAERRRRRFRATRCVAVAAFQKTCRSESPN